MSGVFARCPRCALRLAGVRLSSSQASAAGSWWRSSERRGVLLFTGLSLGCFGLGVWQVQRRKRKLRLIDERQQSLSQPPVSLPSCVSEQTLQQCSYRPYIVNGTWLHHLQMLLGPRGGPQAVTGKESSSAGISKGGLGYYVITPLQLTDGGVVLVNRGWVPRKLKLQALQNQAVDTPAVVVVRPDEASSCLVQQTGASADNVWFRLNVAEIAQSTKELAALHPFILDVIQEEGQMSAEGLPICRRRDDYMQFPTSPLIHSAYAVTWWVILPKAVSYLPYLLDKMKYRFSLAAAGIAMTARFRKRWR